MLTSEARGWPATRCCCRCGSSMANRNPRGRSSDRGTNQPRLEREAARVCGVRGSPPPLAPGRSGLDWTGDSYEGGEGFKMASLVAARLLPHWSFLLPSFFSPVSFSGFVVSSFRSSRGDARVRSGPRPRRWRVGPSGASGCGAHASVGASGLGGSLAVGCGSRRRVAPSVRRAIFSRFAGGDVWAFVGVGSMRTQESWLRMPQRQSGPCN